MSIPSQSSCTCDYEAGVLVVSADCRVHGIGSAYWDKKGLGLNRGKPDGG